MEKCAEGIGMAGRAKTIGRYSIYILFFLCCAALYVLYIRREISGFQDSMPTLVHSRGILASCDLHSANPSSSTSDLGIDISLIKEGSTVYICSSAIRTLISVLDSIPHRFTLVSGDSDETIPDTVFSTNDDFIKFIESNKIIHWFTQNCAAQHPKLTAIPIGLDYHTLSAGAMEWGPQQSGLEQEHELLEIRDAAPPFSQRKMICYSNFHFNKQSNRRYTYDREDAISDIPQDLIFYEPTQLPRLDSWKHQTEYAFVVSPHGNGLDCHRTWEALCLGCIVIVKTSPIDILYDDLPVLIVQNWVDITTDLLDNTIQQFKTKQFDYNRLTLAHWMKLIRSKSSSLELDDK